MKRYTFLSILSIPYPTILLLSTTSTILKGNELYPYYLFFIYIYLFIYKESTLVTFR